MRRLIWAVQDDRNAPEPKPRTAPCSAAPFREGGLHRDGAGSGGPISRAGEEKSVMIDLCSLMRALAGIFRQPGSVPRLVIAALFVGACGFEAPKGGPADGPSDDAAADADAMPDGPIDAAPDGPPPCGAGEGMTDKDGCRPFPLSLTCSRLTEAGQEKLQVEVVGWITSGLLGLPMLGMDAAAMMCASVSNQGVLTHLCASAPDIAPWQPESATGKLTVKLPFGTVEYFTLSVAYGTSPNLVRRWLNIGSIGQVGGSGSGYSCQRVPAPNGTDTNLIGDKVVKVSP